MAKIIPKINEPLILQLPPLNEALDKSCQFKNCIIKNYRHIRKWANKSQTNCFRIYDRDIKAYPVAIDYYAGRFLIHYYFSERNEDGPSAELEHIVTNTITDLFGNLSHPLIWKNRVKRAKTEQYNKQASKGEFFTVYEHGVKFWVNLEDYLDTGLFLDHRETRQIVAKASQGKSLLNLFAYTSAFSVHAAAAGAQFTKSVDMSNTYMQWSRNNFQLNGISQQHHTVVRADCFKFLQEEHRLYDVIVIDPPTLSRSKKMEDFFDIQLDYPDLISQSLRLLQPNGILFFSTNSRKFTFDTTLFPDCSIIDITKATLPIDFHNQRVHKCWKIKPIHQAS